MRMIRMFLFVLLAQTALAQQPTASIQVTITQVGATDTKIPGATVELRREGSVVSLAGAPLLATVTDGEGKYYFPNLAPGQYRVVAKAGRYVRIEIGPKLRNCGGLAIR